MPTNPEDWYTKPLTPDEWCEMVTDPKLGLRAVPAQSPEPPPAPGWKIRVLPPLALFVGMALIFALVTQCYEPSPSMPVIGAEP